MLIAQLSYSEIDTLSYPRLAYPGEVVKDTCIEFTPLQAKLAMIDGINADSYKEQNDSLKSVVIDYQTFVNQKNAEIRELVFGNKVREDIIGDYKLQKDKYKSWYDDSENRLKLTKTVDKVVYPILGGTIVATVLYIAISSVLHK
jgi:hypothetical protein